MISRRSFITATGACLAVPITLGAASKSWGQTRNIRVRKNLMTLSDSDPFFGQYAEAVKAMHRLPPADPRNWFAQAISMLISVSMGRSILSLGIAHTWPCLKKYAET